MAWIESLPDDEDAIAPDDPVFAFAGKASIPADFVFLAWDVFKDRYATNGKRQKSWPMTFRNAVKGNWFKLWWFSDKGCELTTAGIQAQRVAEMA